MASNNVIDFNLFDLLVVFSELLPITDEELKIYFLRFKTDGALVDLSFNVYEKSVGVILNGHGEKISTHLEATNCKSIRVLDERKGIIEVLCGENAENNLRCLLILDESPSLSISYPRTDLVEIPSVGG